jgi:hypothetical protein
MCCDVDPDEVPAVEPEDDEGIEQVETNRWNNEQVHGGDVRCVVTKVHVMFFRRVGTAMPQDGPCGPLKQEGNVTMSLGVLIAGYEQPIRELFEKIATEKGIVGAKAATLEFTNGAGSMLFRSVPSERRVKLD